MSSLSQPITCRIAHRDDRRSDHRSDSRFARRLSLVHSLAIAASFVVFMPTIGLAQSFESSEEAVEGGREALDGWSSYPWYDAEADSAKPINAKPPSKPWNPNIGGNWSWLGTMIRWGFWLMIALIVAFLIYLAYRIFTEQDLTVHHVARQNHEDHLLDQTRIEALPFQVDRGITDLLGEARNAYEQGDYARAIVYLFSYQLVQLDKHQWIRLARGKTNRQYLREVRGSTPLHSQLGETMIAFEDVFFGHYPLEKSRFEANWADLDRFNALVAEGAK